MRQVEGDRNFVAPPLKSAPVFGGIAGIMTSEQGDGEDGSNMPSMSSKAQEIGKLQDMYRQNLAASWAVQAGELPPDKCIEDIFAGGDGWGDWNASMLTGNTKDDDSDVDRGGGSARGHHQRSSSGSTLKPSQRHHVKQDSGGPPAVVSGRTSIEQQVQANGGMKKLVTTRKFEIDEFAEREDLRSWEIAAPV